ncbi:uncharacterized protein LOC119179266 isoform X3 [Rhipicephalus microplus]|uniref:uncharacterized protein LOC119179266 isoform X3 n=1 Tax=Rhipicephalus microplus TaxID=6941 RepID=UPI003F6D758C
MQYIYPKVYSTNLCQYPTTRATIDHSLWECPALIWDSGVAASTDDLRACWRNGLLSLGLDTQLWTIQEAQEAGGRHGLAVSSPKDVLTFRHPQRERGIEVLKATIEITNRSSRTVNFCFTDDPEYNFSPRSSCIAPESTVVVFAKFYNVDGNCQPRRSSVVLRAIRVRNEDEEGVERLWKRTHPDHIGEKRWKLRFEKDQPISGVPIFPNVKKRISYAAKIRVPWKSAATRVAECVGGFPLSQLLLIVVVMGIAVLIGYLVMCVVKSRPTPVKTYAVSYLC